MSQNDLSLLTKYYLEDNLGPEPREHVQTQGPHDPLLLLAFARHAAAVPTQ